MLNKTRTALVIALLALTPVLAGPWQNCSQPGTNDPATPSPRDVRIDGNAQPGLLAAVNHTASTEPEGSTPVASAAHDARLRHAQRIRTGTITGAESSHLVHMERQVREVRDALQSASGFSAQQWTILKQALNDASQVIFYSRRPGSAPRVRDAVASRLHTGRAAEREEAFGQFVRLAHVHRMLAGPPQTPRKRVALEAEFAQLASRLYE